MKFLKIKLKHFLIFLTVITFLFEGVNVFLSNQVSTESVTVTKLNKEIEELDQQNFTIRGEVLDYTSLEQVASRAAELGFVENKKVISLFEGSHVAIR